MSRAVATKYAPPADYLELVARFPIRPLRSEAEYKAAMRVIEPLIGRQDLSEGEDAYLDALSHFIVQFEDERHPADLSKISPLEMLKALMEHREMHVSDLARVIGSRTLASMIVNGQRGISKGNVMKLAAFFRVDPGVFMPSAASKTTSRSR